MDKTCMVCRCEEINAQEIEEAIRLGARNHDDIKRLTRCGMGPCQSKICRSLVAEVIAEVTGKPRSEIPVPRLRVPLYPILMGVLANHQGEDSAIRSVLAEADPEEGRGE
ncbi:(2Fe-2S)-binding protein [Ammoniphilus sp. 3BR4]|uniref:(2Fe-2S)-binding protein n=1 Tax=Ammoniphilus sp. 3BR4 TaxID=3158265 RepID=UPI003465A1C1